MDGRTGDGWSGGIRGMAVRARITASVVAGCTSGRRRRGLRAARWAAADPYGAVAWPSIALLMQARRAVTAAFDRRRQVTTTAAAEATPVAAGDVFLVAATPRAGTAGAPGGARRWRRAVAAWPPVRVPRAWGGRGRGWAPLPRASTGRQRRGRRGPPTAWRRLCRVPRRCAPRRPPRR